MWRQTGVYFLWEEPFLQTRRNFLIPILKRILSRAFHSCLVGSATVQCRRASIFIDSIHPNENQIVEGTTQWIFLSWLLTSFRWASLLWFLLEATQPPPWSLNTLVSTKIPLMLLKGNSATCSVGLQRVKSGNCHRWWAEDGITHVDNTLHKTLKWDRPKISQLTLPYFKVLIVVGGVDADQALASSELLDYSRAGSTWSPATSLPAPMWGARGIFLLFFFFDHACLRCLVCRSIPPRWRFFRPILPGFCPILPGFCPILPGFYSRLGFRFTGISLHLPLARSQGPENPLGS